MSAHTSPEDFVLAWRECKSVREVAERLGMLPTSVYIRANRLRKKGVHLPSLSNNKLTEQRVEALNRLLVGASSQEEQDSE
jgi:hypothetical protein